MTQRRIYQSAFPYHITFNTLHREWIFEDEKKARLLHEIILNAGDLKNHTIYQFCIMPDHVHLLCKTDEVVGPHRGLAGDRSPRTLERVRCDGGGSYVFCRVPFPGCDVKNPNNPFCDAETVRTGGTCGAALSNFVQSIKGTFSRKMNMGHIWHRRFHDEIIERDDQLLNTIEYIEQNPLSDELPEKWQKYPYQYYNHDLIQKLFF